MQTHDARILRGAVIPTAVVGVAAVGGAAALDGAKGAIGAAIGVAVVMAFFTIGLLAVVYASRVSATVMMQVALFTYLVKVLAMLGLIAVLQNVTFWNPRIFSLVVIVSTLVWIVGEIRALFKAKMLYVEPDGTG